MALRSGQIPYGNCPEGLDEVEGLEDGVPVDLLVRDASLLRRRVQAGF